MTQQEKFNLLMGNRNYHVVIDGATPIGGIKFVNNTSGDETIVYPDGVDKKIKELAKATEAEETIVATEEQVEQEEKVMKTTKKQHKHRGIARFLAEKAVTGALKASYGAGFATGFAKESIKLASQKSKLVDSFRKGYHAGEEAARKKAESKAAKKAASELMEEFDWNAAEDEFNERFADCIYCDYPNCDECHLRTW